MESTVLYSQKKDTFLPEFSICIPQIIISGYDRERGRRGKRRQEKPNTLWLITAKNTDLSTGPLASPFARSLAPLTRSLAPDCSLRSRPPLRSLIRSLSHFAHSLACGTMNDWMAILSVFFSIFNHSVVIKAMVSNILAFYNKLLIYQ